MVSQCKQCAELKDEIKRLNLEVCFLVRYYNPKDTSFKQMVETFSGLSEENKNRIIELTKALGQCAEARLK